MSVRRPSQRPLGRRAPPPEALMVAMAIAPGVYVRNRMFELFADAAVQRARGRAAMLRGVVAQLGRATVVALMNEGEASFALRYEIAEMRLVRVVQLTRTELAVLRILASRAGLSALPPEPADRTLVDTALARLMPGEAVDQVRASLD